jgi:hypothetical protein
VVDMLLRINDDIGPGLCFMRYEALSLTANDICSYSVITNPKFSCPTSYLI